MIIYDLETEKAIKKGREMVKTGIQYCEGFHDFDNMGISVIGCYDTEGNRMRVFLKDNFNEFQELLNRTDCIVGFNNKQFDNRVLIANGFSINPAKTYDILQEIWRSLGLGPEFDFRTHAGLSLGAVAYANFKCGKTGDGAKAPIDWQENRRGSVIDYCLADVELTRRLLFKIINCGYLRNPKTNLDIPIRRPSPEVKP